MTEYTSHFNNDLLFKNTLKNFGIEADCSFEMLRQCSMMYDSTPADTPVRRWHDDIIKRLVKCDDSLIDLGCGDGELMLTPSAAATPRPASNHSNIEERAHGFCHAPVAFNHILYEST